MLCQQKVNMDNFSIVSNCTLYTTYSRKRRQGSNKQTPKGLFNDSENGFNYEMKSEKNLVPFIFVQIKQYPENKPLKEEVVIITLFISVCVHGNMRDDICAFFLCQTTLFCLELDVSLIVLANLTG